MIKKEGLGPTVEKAFSVAESETVLCQLLTETRLRAGMTQQQFAEKIGAVQSTISKWEDGPDSELTLDILGKYARVFGGQIALFIGQPMNHVECVKLHALEIKRHLSALASLANECAEMEKDIQAFFGQAFFNILTILAKCQQEMPKSKGASRIKAFYVGERTPPSQVQSSEPVEAGNAA